MVKEIVLTDVEPQDILRHLDEWADYFQTRHQENETQENETWRQWLALKEETNLAHIKSIYLEALQKGKSTAWAEGKIEGLGLQVKEDEELQYIQELFS